MGDADLDFIFETMGYESTDEGSEGRDKEEKSDGVGEKAWGEEDCTCEEDENTIGRFLVGKAALGERLSEVGEGLSAFGSGQGGTNEARDHDDCDGVEEAEFFPEGHEERELNEGDNDEKDQ